ncbi:MAG: hypothetical protein R3B99_23400 [Polyangiales bacterium]|nr:hypothetical protein [Myxococcales bacterium]
MRFVLVLALLGCGTSAVEPTDAPPPPVLTCDVPVETRLVASTEPPNAGVPMAGIGWDGTTCVFLPDQNATEHLIVLADLTGFLAGSLSVVSVNGWRIEESTLGGPTTSIPGLPRDTDLRFVLRRDGVRVGITLRIEGEVVRVLAMSLE